MRTVTRSRWWMPVFCLALGGLLFGAFAIGGEPGEGLAALAVMAVVGLVFLLGTTRSETLAGLGGPGRDERWAMIDLRATALSGLALIVATAGAWLYQLAQDEDGSPYSELMAVAGIAYLLAVAVLRLRS